jgi:hypothetical protein
MATRTLADPAADLATLARLHAALDSVVETEQVVAVIRVSALLGEARELLRGLLVRADRRYAVGSPDSLAVSRAGS